MSDVAIRVENLGKMYRIGGKQERYRTLRDTITDIFTSPFKKTSALLSGQAYAAANLHEEIWALKDVSFEIKHGEVVGIIGRNGAGKSTLLKILSRITEPTTGYVDIYGRVGALLEVGTGFHPELTGRENVYLNGAILGMSRAEIDRKFDEIVDFAGVEKFIDTPVKHYSSGMGLRLGFAVAAHLEPDILVVDEVLAVGDAEFQKKCLGKMSDVAGEGRTVLFVSHNMAAVSQLCSRSIWLHDGIYHKDDLTPKVIEKYLQSNRNNTSVSRDLSLVNRRHNIYVPTLQEVRLKNGKDYTTKFFTLGQITIEVDCLSNPSKMKTASLGIVITNSIGSRVIVSHFDQYKYCKIDSLGSITFKATVDRLMLTPGLYQISLHLSNGSSDVDMLENVISFDVEWDPNIKIKYPPKSNWGDIFTDFNWSIEKQIQECE